MASNLPNVILITTDQQRFDTIRATGNETIRTPHMDYLSRIGTVFTRAYADCPICIPARWSIMNGLAAASFNHAHYSDNNDSIIDEKKSLPGILTKNGYQTQAIGKMHFKPLRKRYGFENMMILQDYYNMMAKHPEYGVPMNHGVGQNEIYPVMSTVQGSHTLTAWTVDESINFLQTRDESCPFFLWTSFSKPHPPFDPPEPYYSMYRDKKMPERARGGWIDKIQCQTGHIWDDRTHPFDAITDDTRDDSLRAYYGLITQIDFNLGRLLGVMREMDLMQNTLIIFTSDHGEMMGDFGGYGKGTFFEGSAHIPFIIKWPGIPAEKQGEFCPVPVTHADILPTVLDFLGIDEELCVDGISIKKLLSGESDRKCITGEYSYQNPSETKLFITDGRYKYFYYVNGGAELLFDLETDPKEETDLCENGEFESIKQCLKSELTEKLKKSGSKHVDSSGNLVCVPLSCLPERTISAGLGLHSRWYPCDVLH